MAEAGLAWRWRLFDLVWRFRMRRAIRAVRVAGLPAGLPGDVPLILCANHVSWWDGFVLRHLQTHLRPAAGLRALMLQRELDRRPLLRLLGAEGLEPGGMASLRSAARRLRELRERDSGLVLAFFPQGMIRTSRARPLEFRPGIRLFRRMLQPVWTLPVALHLEFLDRAVATAFVSVGRPLGPEHPEGREEQILADRVSCELDAVLHFLDRHGENALERWPEEVRPLPRDPRVGRGGGSSRAPSAGPGPLETRPARRAGA